MAATIWVDADACPVKEEVYRVARRYQWRVILVTNTWLRIDESEMLRLVVVPGHADAADDWIAAHVQADEIVITADIPLAARCLEVHAKVLDPRGGEFKDTNIGSALAAREIMDQLRGVGVEGSGPPPFSKRDRSLFLQKLDQMIQAV
ncbi:YaiI/YqxD family protein [Planctomycetaceae bacterium SH139]